MSLAFFVTSWPGRIVALALGIGVIFGAVTFVRGGQPAATAAPRTATVTRGSVTQTVSVSGSVNASGQARLSFKSSGRLANVSVSVGQSVVAGQALATLDTTDLQTALSTAQQNLASAQASYQKQVLASQDTRRSLEDTQRQTATNIANAQATLNKVTSNYNTAKFNFTSLTNQIKNDTQTLQQSLAALRQSTSALLVALQNSTTQTTDVKAATNQIQQASTNLETANAYSVNLLAGALIDFGNAQGALLQSTQAFDAAIAAGTDTTGIAAALQTQQLNYATAASRLSSAIDSVNGAIQAAQANVSSAQNSLNSSSTSQDATLQGQRADAQNLLVMIAQTSSNAAVAKSRISQASTALGTVSDTIQSSYANAVQALQNAQDQAATSIRQAQSAVANIPFNLQSAQTSVDNASNTVATAQSNLDAAVLTAPAAGIVASIANQVGEFVTGGNTNNAFIVLTNTTALVLHGTIGEADVSKLKLGQVANITIDALAGQKMTGKVTSLDPVATIQQGVPVYGIDVTIDVPATTVKAGMSGTAAVIIASKQNVLIVPNTAIRSVNGQRGLSVLKDGETVDTVAQFGLSNDTSTEVVSGVAEGDVVVIPQARTGTATQRPGGGFGGGGVIVPGR